MSLASCLVLKGGRKAVYLSGGEEDRIGNSARKRKEDRETVWDVAGLPVHVFALLRVDRVERFCLVSPRKRRRFEEREGKRRAKGEGIRMGSARGNVQPQSTECKRKDSSSAMTFDRGGGSTSEGNLS
eukprot:159675-Rhodomonas_salina.4